MQIAWKTTYRRTVVIGFFCVLLLLLFWLLGTLPDWQFSSYRHRVKGAGAFLGIAGYCFFSLSLFLSSRCKKLENWFGGLDQIYHVHHLFGIWGFSLLVAHPVLLSLRWIPQRMDKFFLFLFPLHDRLSVNLGVYSFWLMLLLLSITFCKLLPYDKWKISHKCMSLVFLLASSHFLFSNKLFGSLLFSKLLLCIPFAIGSFGIIHKQVIFYFIKRPLYEVNKIEVLNSNTIEISLSSKAGRFSFIPGQYAFFSFRQVMSFRGITKEWHPFTLCGAVDGSQISIIVKARGDFTSFLYRQLRLGDLAYVEGPYGRFNYRKAGNTQVWIAGGIGIVPFLVWARGLRFLQHVDTNIDLFYCVHREQDLFFFDELQQISREIPQFRCFCFCSERKQSLHMKKIQEMTDKLQSGNILLCGPKRLTHTLTKQFCQMGISRERIIFEDFEFL